MVYHDIQLRTWLWVSDLEKKRWKLESRLFRKRYEDRRQSGNRKWTQFWIKVDEIVFLSSYSTKNMLFTQFHENK